MLFLISAHIWVVVEYVLLSREEEASRSTSRVMYGHAWLRRARDGIYEPEQFPGLILRNEKPKVTYLVFHSGKVVIAGSKSLQELEQAAEKLQELVDTSDDYLN